MKGARRALDGLEGDIRDHIERETQDNLERGMAPELVKIWATIPKSLILNG